MLKTRDIVKVVFGWAPGSINDTSWLNGVRGLAAFLVMMAHYTHAWLSPLADAPFGATIVDDFNNDDIWYYRQGDRVWELWRLPILRLFMSAGGPQVAVFFVISGFVLTWSPLKSVQLGEHASNGSSKLFHTLGSSTFRRWFRLYPSCVIVTIAFLVHGLYQKYHGFVPMLEQILGFFTAAVQWANPFRPILTHETEIASIYAYNLVLWTIPLEFKGSIFVYVLLLCFGRVRSYRKRALITVLTSLLALLSNIWDLWLFGVGMALADYVRHSGCLTRQPSSTVSRVLWSVCFATSLLLLSFMPTSAHFNRPGYEWTIHVPLPLGFRDSIGEERFWWGLGGILLIASCCHLNVRRFFELALLQHLGKISFMLYLIHFLISHTIAMPIRAVLYAVMCNKEFDGHWNTDLYRTSALVNISIYIVLWLICVPIVLVVSQILEAFVDRPVTAFGKWLDEVLLTAPHTEKDILMVEQAEEQQLLEAGELVEDMMEEMPPAYRDRSGTTSRNSTSSRYG